MKHLLRPDSLKDSVVTNEVGTGEPTPGSTGWPKDKDGIFGTSKAGVRWSSTWSRYELEQTYTEKYEREKYEVWKREVWSMKERSMKYEEKSMKYEISSQTLTRHPRSHVHPSSPLPGEERVTWQGYLQDTPFFFLQVCLGLVLLLSTE